MSYDMNGMKMLLEFDFDNTHSKIYLLRIKKIEQGSDSDKLNDMSVSK